MLSPNDPITPGPATITYVSGYPAVTNKLNQGLRVREHFSLEILKSLLLHPNYDRRTPDGVHLLEHVVSDAVNFADQLIEELNKPAAPEKSPS